MESTHPSTRPKAPSNSQEHVSLFLVLVGPERVKRRLSAPPTVPSPPPLRPSFVTCLLHLHPQQSDLGKQRQREHLGFQRKHVPRSENTRRPENRQGKSKPPFLSLPLVVPLAITSGPVGEWSMLFFLRAPPCHRPYHGILLHDMRPHFQLLGKVEP